MKTLDKNERRVLIKKYLQSGLDYPEALEKVNKFHEYLKDMQKKLTKQGKENKDIAIKFKEEFWNLCRNLER